MFYIKDIQVIFEFFLYIEGWLRYSKIFQQTEDLYHMSCRKSVNIYLSSLIMLDKFIHHLDVLYITYPYAVLFLDKWIGYLFMIENRISHYSKWYVRTFWSWRKVRIYWISCRVLYLLMITTGKIYILPVFVTLLVRISF